MGRKMVPYTTIRDRMEKKDLRFEQEARQRAALRTDDERTLSCQRPLTHEQRQELIHRPIVFNYIGGHTTGGISVFCENFHRSIGGGFDTGSKDWELD